MQCAEFKKFVQQHRAGRLELAIVLINKVHFWHLCVDVSPTMLVSNLAWELLMQAGIINKTPEQWLKDQGEAPKRISEVLASFEKNATVRVCIYRKEHLFIQFHPVPDPKWTRDIHGKKLPEGIYLPNYWADASALGTASRRASQFKGWLTDAEISAIAKRNYREITAVCWNWNEFDDNQLWKLEPRGKRSGRRAGRADCTAAAMGQDCHGASVKGKLYRWRNPGLLEPEIAFPLHACGLEGYGLAGVCCVRPRGSKA